MDSITAAEAILATVAAARGRIAALAHGDFAGSGLSFGRALAVELEGRLGASPERVTAELAADLFDHRLSLLQLQRGAAQPTRLALPVLPIAVGSAAERVEDEPTPLGAPVQESVFFEPELTLPGPELTGSGHEPTMEASAPALTFALDDHGAAQTPAPEDGDAEAAPVAEAPVPEIEAERKAAPLEPEPVPLDEIPLVRFSEPAPVAETAWGGPSLVRFHDEAPPLVHFPGEPVDALTDEATHQSADPLSDQDYDDQLLDEAVEAALDDEDPSISGELDDDLDEDAMLERELQEAERLEREGQAAAAALAALQEAEQQEGEPPEAPPAVYERPEEEEVLGEPPTELGELMDALRGRVPQDEDEVFDEAPPQATLLVPATVQAEPELLAEPPPVQRTPVAEAVPTAPARLNLNPVPAGVEDDERTVVASAQLLAELGDPVTDEEEEAPPARQPARAGASVVVNRPRGAADELEAPPPDHEDGGDNRGGGFAVTLERPKTTYQVDDSDDEPSAVLTLPNQATGPRLTDDADMVSPAEVYAEPTPIDPRQVAEFLQKARDAEGRGDLARAVLHYRDLLDLTPESIEAALGRGRCLMEMGDYAAAMSDFQRAEDLDPRSPEPLVEMGNLFFARKEYRRAIEFYDQAIEIDPTHAMARCRRGISHHYRKNHKQAFQDLQRAYSLNPDIPNIRKYVQMAVKAMEKSR